MATIGDKMRVEKRQQEVNREAAKISSLLSTKIGKYEYLTDNKMLSTSKIQTIEQAKFKCSPLGKNVKKRF